MSVCHWVCTLNYFNLTTTVSIVIRLARKIPKCLSLVMIILDFLLSVCISIHAYLTKVNIV